MQYIRNRKVRARERKAIDGECQGFGDIYKVTEWVDEVARWMATGQIQAQASRLLPPYPCADEFVLQSSPPPGSRAALSSSKPKRPRVDWFIEPSDLLADAYWLEQTDNKKFLEDRYWRRVFPQDSELYSTTPQSIEKVVTSTSAQDEETPLATMLSTETGLSESRPAKAEHDHLLSNARDRAQQKLRALKGHHHRRTSSLYGQDVLRPHRGSISDSSDTDNDRRRRGLNGTVGNNGQLLLEKQVMDMIAQEQKEEQQSHSLHPTSSHTFPAMNSHLATPERERPRWSPAPSRQPSHSRQKSRAELSESDSKVSRTNSHQPASPRPGRASLEVPLLG